MRAMPVLVSSLLVACGPHPKSSLPLTRVVLFQNGIGYFERVGTIAGTEVPLRFSPYEVDDVLKTVTAVPATDSGSPPPASGAQPAAVASVDVGTAIEGERDVSVRLRLSSGGQRRVQVSYAVPTPAWKPTYRLVLDDSGRSLLQGWAMVHNTSGEDWPRVRLSLAAGAPFSYALTLRAPSYVDRPNLDGQMVSPVKVVVRAEAGGASELDNDGDGLRAAVDKCPERPEDRDDFEDDDGCPDDDNDKDNVRDAADKCPNNPETYNGLDDEDGCPDRGRTVITEAAVEVLEMIYFAKGSVQLTEASLAILDAVVATLKTYPDISLTEISGHTSDDEADPWGLSQRRADAVLTALYTRGVPARRLTAQGYGASQPLVRGAVPSARAKNRRVSFLILKRESAQAPAPAVSVASVAQSARPETRPVEVSGATRYELAEPVTIPKDSATMIAIVNQTLDAEEVYLFRPSEDVAGSAMHPLRAARVQNETSFPLQPGAMSIFSRGTYVGDSLIDVVPQGDTTFAPFALDASAKVRVRGREDELPLSIVSARRGTIEIEVARRRFTSYEIDAPAGAPRRIFLRHPVTAPYRLHDPPPGSIQQSDAWLLAVPLVPGTPTAYVVEERWPLRRSYELAESYLPELTTLLAGGKVPDVAQTALRAALAQRPEVARLATEAEALRQERGETLARVAELRATMAALGAGPEGAELRRKLVSDIRTAMAQLDRVSKDLAETSRHHVAALAKLRELVREVVIEEAKP